MPNRTLARPRSHALHLSAPDQRRFLWAVAREVLCVQSHQYGLERNLIQGLPDLAEGIEACRGADEDEEADPGKGEPQPPPQPRHKPRNEENAALLRRIGTADARWGLHSMIICGISGNARALLHAAKTTAANSSEIRAASCFKAEPRRALLSRIDQARVRPVGSEIDPAVSDVSARYLLAGLAVALLRIRRHHDHAG